jgi:hypothetical protein
MKNELNLSLNSFRENICSVQQNYLQILHHEDKYFYIYMEIIMIRYISSLVILLESHHIVL